MPGTSGSIAWRIVFWIAVVHVVLMVFVTASLWSVMTMRSFQWERLIWLDATALWLATQPLWMFAVALPANCLVMVIAARTGRHGRSGRLILMPAALALLCLLVAITALVYLVQRGHIQVAFHVQGGTWVVFTTGDIVATLIGQGVLFLPVIVGGGVALLQWMSLRRSTRHANLKPSPPEGERVKKTTGL